MRNRIPCILAALLLAGCQGSGSGMGYLHDGSRSAVAVEWHGEADSRGSLRIELAGGRVFVGTYYQITSESRIEHLAPLWIGWRPGWRGWPYWQHDPGPEFVRHYSGQVVANLAADDGERLRCSIQLARPRAGLGGGGDGQCQLANGELIDLQFPMR